MAPLVGTSFFVCGYQVKVGLRSTNVIVCVQVPVFTKFILGLSSAELSRLAEISLIPRS